MTTCTNPAQRRYNIRVALLMTGYVASLFFAKWMVNGGHAHGVLTYALAILPALPVLGVFAAVARLIVEMSDEYLRMQFVRQVLIATAFALSISTVWGFLEAFDLVPHVDAYFGAILWFAGLGFGTLINALIERTGGRA